MSVRALACAAVIALVTLTALHATALPACTPALEGEGVARISHPTLELAWRATPSPLPRDQPFSVEIAVCSTDSAQDGTAPRLIAVDAVMPAHGHGMNYRPSVQEIGPGRYRVAGLLWHMRGRWEWRFSVQTTAALVRLTQAVELP